MAVELETSSFPASVPPCTDIKSRCRFQLALRCSICDGIFGWWRLRPRHHCRFCGISVCGGCAQSYIEVEGQYCLQRSCNNCCTIIPKAHVVKIRLQMLSDHLYQQGSGDSSGGIIDSIMDSPRDSISSQTLSMTSPGSGYSFWSTMDSLAAPKDLDIFKKSEVSLTKQGFSCKVSDILFVMASSMNGMTKEASSAAHEVLMVGKRMCGFERKRTCSICHNALGKRKCRPRHHCRFCGCSVCGNCSRSSVAVEGQRGTHRACNTCASLIPTSHKIMNRLNNTAGRIRAIGSSETSTRPLDAIDEAIRMSQMDLTALDDSTDDVDSQKASLNMKRSKSLAGIFALLDTLPDTTTSQASPLLKRSQSLQTMKLLACQPDTRDRDAFTSMRRSKSLWAAMHEEETESSDVEVVQNWPVEV